MNSFHRACGRLGYLTQHPEKAKPGELDSLTDVFLRQGRRSNQGTDWLSTGQMETRQTTEIPLHESLPLLPGDGHWLAAYK